MEGGFSIKARGKQSRPVWENPGRAAFGPFLRRASEAREKYAKK